MATSSESHAPSSTSKSFTNKLTKKNILFSYLPVTGVASYELFSIHVLNPKFLQGILPDNHLGLANALLFNANLGMGLYLYNRPHMISEPNMFSRVVYSVFGAVMFNFGSILLWATTKVALPKCMFARVLFGLGSGAGLLYTGWCYVRVLDKNAREID